MKNISLFLLLIIFSAGTSMAQNADKKYLVYNSKVEISVPPTYSTVSEEKTGIRAFQPDMIKSPGAILSFSASNENITDNDIPAYADDRLKLAKQDDESFTYIDDGIHLHDGKNIGYLKFSTKEGKQKYFNYTFFISVDDKPLVFQFTCLFKEQKKWEAQMDKVAGSLRVTQ